MNDFKFGNFTDVAYYSNFFNKKLAGKMRVKINLIGAETLTINFFEKTNKRYLPVFGSAVILRNIDIDDNGEKYGVYEQKDGMGLYCCDSVRAKSLNAAAIEFLKKDFECKFIQDYLKSAEKAV